MLKLRTKERWLFTSCYYMFTAVFTNERGFDGNKCFTHTGHGFCQLKIQWSTTDKEIYELDNYPDNKSVKKTNSVCVISHKVEKRAKNQRLCRP